MIRILHKLISFILFLWSYSVILSLTDDSNFGTVEYKVNFKDDVREPRFSLINIMLGDKALYIFSYKFKTRKMSLGEFKTLENLFVPIEEEMESITTRYIEHLSLIAPEDIEIEKEALIDHINNEELRIAKSGEKINLYTTIILTVTPLLLAIIDLKQFFTLNNLSKVILVMMAYSILNIMLYIFQSAKIQEIRRCRFSDLRTSENHKFEINKQYQYNWQFLRRKADCIVSYVKNLQYWIVGLVILSFILAVSSVSSVSTEYLNNAQVVRIDKSQRVINISIDETDDPYSDSSISITLLNLKIQKREVQHILIISYDESIVIDLVNKLKNTYNGLNIKIIVDEELDNKTIKIIEEG